MSFPTLMAATAALVAPPHTTTFRTPSESMVPTVEVGGRVTATVGAYESRAVERGDIVLIHPPSVVEVWDGPQCGDAAQSPGQMCPASAPGLTDVTWVKRVVGLPGDQLSLSRGHLMQRRSRRRAVRHLGDDRCDYPTTITVPADRYFLLGDNRGASDDSRFWGPLPKEALFARADHIAPPPPENPRPKRMRQPSESMEPTIELGGRVVLNYDAYDHGDPQRADIVVLHPPAGAEAKNTCGKEPLPGGEMCPRSTRGYADVRFVKRIVGVPGVRLSLRHGRVIRNGKRVHEPYIAGCRFWGPVRRKGLVARVDRCIPQPAKGCPRRR